MFLESFFANLLSEGIVATLIGLILYRYFEAKSKEKERKQKLKIASNMLWGEIDRNRGRLKLMIRYMPRGDLVTPGLETSAWDVLDKSLIIDYLNLDDVASILGIYAQSKTINDHYEMLLENVNWITEAAKTTVKKEFIDQFIERCKNLLNDINEFIPEKGRK